MQDFNKTLKSASSHCFKIKASAQKGVSLIELMVSVTLGVIVILGVSQSLSNMVISSRLQEQNSNMQQTADMALSYVDYRLRNALATPCASLLDIKKVGRLKINPVGTLGNYNGSPINDVTVTRLINNRNGIEVRRGNVSVGGNATTTDNLTTVGAGQKRVITNATGINTPVVRVDGGFTFKIKGGDDPLYVITDCRYADIFRADSALAGNITTLTPAAGTVFNSNYRSTDSALVAPLEISELSINSAGELNDRTIYDADGTTLIDDVELMRLLFGIDTTDDGRINRYITANQLDAGMDVVSAEIYLLVRASGGQANSDVGNYSVTLPNTSQNIAVGAAIPTQTLNFADRVMRKVFTRTVTFRNNASL